MTDTPSTSGDIKLRAQKLMERYPVELAKAIHVKDTIEYTMTPGDLPKLRKPREDANPLLLPRKKPLHIGAVSISRPKPSHKAAAKRDDLQYVIDVRAAVWSLLSDAGKDAELFDKLLSIEVTEKKDGSLKYGLFRAGAAYHELTTSKFDNWTDDIIDPREMPLQPPPRPEELAKQQTAERIAARPDAVVVTSDPED